MTIVRTAFEDAIPRTAWEHVSECADPDRRLLAGPWFEAWVRHLIPRDGWRGPVRYAVVRDESRNALAIVPLAVQKLSALRFSALGGYYFPFRAFPASFDRREEVAAAIEGALRRDSGGIGFRFGPVEQGDPFVSVLVGRMRTAHWTLIRRDSGTEFLVEMPSSVEAFRAQLSWNLRTNIPYKERRMNREGRVRIDFVHAGTQSEWNGAIQAMGAIEAESWVGRAADGHLHFRDERNARFWSDILAEPAPSRAARAWVLYFNDLPASFCFSLDSGQRRYFIAGLHTHAVARYSPGYMLMQRMLEDAISSGIKVVNLGVGDAGYKTRWGAKGDEQLEDWIALRPGLLGKGLAAAWRLRQRVGRARVRLEGASRADGKPVDGDNG